MRRHSTTGLRRLSAGACVESGGCRQPSHTRTMALATALNLQYTAASQAPEMDWEQQSEKVRERYNRIAKLPLSALLQAGDGGSGVRGACMDSRGTWSMVCMEAYPAPEAAVDRLDGWTARLIDRGQESRPE